MKNEDENIKLCKKCVSLEKSVTVSEILTIHKSVENFQKLSYGQKQTNKETKS